MAIRIPYLWVDHRPRLEFYVRHGLLAQSPTDAQLAKAFDEMKTQVGILGQLIYYAKNPRMIFPSAAKREFVDNPRVTGDSRPTEDVSGTVQQQRAAQAPLDRFLFWLFLFAPARLAAKSVCNPWELIPSAGLNTPAGCLIAHILQTPHPSPALWDLQVIHPDEGALDRLERHVDDALLGRSTSARINRALGSRPRQFEELKELIPRVHRFDYPPQPDGTEEKFLSLVGFLRYASEL
ncbi:MAG: hypothetical protein VX574_04915 [Myxococcota bacterium]|nr:hypothetical protein [Myxococcota bacterium]